MQVTLRNIVLAWLNPITPSGQKYALALATGLGFYYESLCLPIVELFFERLQISRQQPRLWEEVVVFREVLLHGGQIFGEQILPCQSIHPRKVVCALVNFHLDQKSWDGRPINEPQIPVFFLIYACAHVEGRSNLVDQLILSVQYVHY